MKPTLTLALALAAILTTICQADTAVHRAKILKLSSALQQTPRFNVDGVKDKQFNPRHWLEIEAEIEVETTGKSKFIPEITAHWFAVIIDDTTKKSVRLAGITTFKNIRTKDKKIFLSAYIEPDTLERLTGKNRPSKNDIEAVALTLEGFGIISEGKHARGLQKATAKEKSRWWVEWKNETLSNLIVPKSKTPFAPLWTDRYPTEKSDR